VKDEGRGSGPIWVVYDGIVPSPGCDQEKKSLLEGQVWCTRRLIAVYQSVRPEIKGYWRISEAGSKTLKRVFI